MKERGIGVVLLITALGALIALGLITYFIFQAGVPLIAKVGLWQFLSGTEWNPTAKTPKFGILPIFL